MFDHHYFLVFWNEIKKNRKDLIVDGRHSGTASRFVQDRKEQMLARVKKSIDNDFAFP